MRGFTKLAATAAILALSACASSPPPPVAAAAPPPPPPELEAGTWRLASLEDAEPPGPLSIEFDGGKASGKAFCNRFFGEYRRDGAILHVGAVAATRMACPQLDAEQQFFGRFTETDTYEIDADGRLTLVDRDGGRGLVFERP